MNSKMTPCERLGYKVGDEFVMKINDYHKQGETVFLERDDGTDRPIFSGLFVWLSSVNKVAKLKPAKQALADAIHQNGGWPDKTANFAVQSNGNLRVHFTDDVKPPERCVGGGWRCRDGFRFGWSTKPLDAKIKNWHQTVLYRDEYFTAYPEQVKVEVNNETKHKVEPEMKSGSEVTIKVSDWHKSGELPPVGEVCEAYIDYPPQWVETEIVAHKDGFAIGWCKSAMKGCHGDKAHEFRPLRTERDKAIDEMINVGGLRARDGAREVFGRLYDAGMYKEVK